MRRTGSFLLPNPADSGRAVLREVLALAAGRAAAGGPCPLAVDATTGNGHDTLFLAENVGPAGLVLAFDVQEQALAVAFDRLHNAGNTGNAGGAGLSGRVRFVAAGHETLNDYLPRFGTPGEENMVDAAMFNLGFLPGSDKTVVTRPESTLAALRVLETRLRPGGVVSVHCYAGHSGGAEEADAVEHWARALPWKEWHVLRLELTNKTRNQEVLLLVQCLRLFPSRPVRSTKSP